MHSNDRHSFVAQFFPGRSNDGYLVPLTRIVYIESTDFRMDDARGYYGLAPGKSVLLRYACVIECTGFIVGPGGDVIEVHCRRHTLVDGERPPKGVLNWVGQPAPGLEPLRFEARLFDAILRPTATEPTNDRTDDWIQDLNPASLEVVRGSSVTAAECAFAALTRSGTVVAWGSPEEGSDSSTVQHLLVDVVSVTAADRAFAALTRSGTVVTWGDSRFGGDSSDVQHLLVDVVSVKATQCAFAAMTHTGTVVSWGSDYSEGDYFRVVMADVVTLTVGTSAFAALTRSGTVATWGYCDFGGDSSDVQHLLVDVASVTSGGGAFAALTRSGAVVTWGGTQWGGDSSDVQHLLVDVVSVTAVSCGMFAALTRSGTVVTWGGAEYEFGGQSSAVRDLLGPEYVFRGDSTAVQHLLVDVTSVTATRYAFAALTRSGTVVTWGDPELGGDSAAVQHLLVDVVGVTASECSFAAVTRSGTIVVWGWPYNSDE